LEGIVPTSRKIDGMADDEIIERLTTVRGVGRWTVEMLLIFQLGRPDVLPADDFGVRNGFRLAFGRAEMPKPRELLEHGERWRPFRTTAAWYLWRAADKGRVVPAERRLREV
jgi:DNA-3-methyladenine glycosylase II